MREKEAASLPENALAVGHVGFTPAFADGVRRLGPPSTKTARRAER
jgi:hypothetical protein